jgi:hypothetical protein
MHIQTTICAFLICGVELPMFAVWGLVGQSQPTRSSWLFATMDRRDFLDDSLKTSASMLLISQPAFADGDSVDDLSMPTEDELKKTEVSIESIMERIH